MKVNEQGHYFFLHFLGLLTGYVQSAFAIVEDRLDDAIEELHTLTLQDLERVLRISASLPDG